MVTSSYNYNLIKLSSRREYLLNIGYGGSSVTFKLASLSSFQASLVEFFLQNKTFWIYFLKNLNMTTIKGNTFKVRKEQVDGLLFKSLIDSLPSDIFHQKTHKVEIPLALALIVKKTIDIIIDK